MSNPDSYDTVVNIEIKKFLIALAESYEKDVSDRLEAGLTSQEELQRLDKVYTVLFNMVDMFLEDYIHQAPEDALRLYNVNTSKATHELGRRDSDHRPKLESYTASLRTLIRSMDSSYFVKSGFAAFGLEEFRIRLLAGMYEVAELLKYLESMATWVEKYLTWTEHGANIVAKYENALRDEDEDRIEVSEYYQDSRVVFYAILKTTEHDPKLVGNYVSDLSGVVMQASKLLGITHKLYSSLESKDFNNFFNMLSSPKANTTVTNEKQEKKFENIRELNDFIRSKIEKSIDDPVGFVKVAQLLLDNTCAHYISDFITSLSNMLAFFPGTAEQKQYIERFEQGRLWQKENSK